MGKQYETVIGLEVHIELSTKTKIFCGCATTFGKGANTQICPVCAGMPGALPVLNRQVMRYALAMGLALNCHVNQLCKFDRKNYFYPDNPQNYQISQLYLPICQDGYLEILAGAGTKKVRIHELHMEEDAGKLIHDEWADCSLADFNRSGVPLIEIVSEPDMRSADEVIAYLEQLRKIAQYLGISDCRLQEGSMRADVNLSVREVGSSAFGTRTEMKNLNSFKAIMHAIEGERERQIELLEEGKTIIQETRRWDDNKENSRSMRSKEDAKDYRYFPDPDLPPVRIPDAWIAELKEKQPEFAEHRASRYQAEFGLSESDARQITEYKNLADIFEKTVKLSGNARKTANWLTGETFRVAREKGMALERVSIMPKDFLTFLGEVENGNLNNQAAKKVFEAMLLEGCEPLAYMQEHQLKTVRDTGLLEKIVQEVLAQNPKAVEEFSQGKEKVFGFLVGNVMRQMRGKAAPDEVGKMLREKLAELANQ